MLVSKEEFIRYEEVRKSGVTNMFDIPTVEVLACLSREQVKEIMANYEKLAEEHQVGRGH